MKRIAFGVIALACSLAFGGAALAQIPDYVAKAVADRARAQTRRTTSGAKAPRSWRSPPRSLVTRCSS